MPDDSEVVDLLREIRDIQRAHFQRYQEFTNTVAERQQQLAERQEQLAERSAQARQSDQHHRDQVSEFLARSRQTAARMWILVVISVLLQASLIFSLGFIILLLVKR